MLPQQQPPSGVPPCNYGDLISSPDKSYTPSATDTHTVSKTPSTNPQFTHHPLNRLICTSSNKLSNMYTVEMFLLEEATAEYHLLKVIPPLSKTFTFSTYVFVCFEMAALLRSSVWGKKIAEENCLEVVTCVCVFVCKRAEKSLRYSAMAILLAWEQEKKLISHKLVQLKTNHIHIHICFSVMVWIIN